MIAQCKTFKHKTTQKLALNHEDKTMDKEMNEKGYKCYFCHSENAKDKINFERISFMICKSCETKLKRKLLKNALLTKPISKGKHGNFIPTNR